MLAYKAFYCYLKHNKLTDPKIYILGTPALFFQNLKRYLTRPGLKEHKKLSWLPLFFLFSSNFIPSLPVADSLQRFNIKYKHMKYYFLSVIAAFSLNSCSQTETRPSPEARKARLDSLQNDLYQTDLAFSQLSEQKGRNTAFIAYAADNSTLLRPFSMPINGKDSIVSLFNAHADSNYTLSWKPIKAEVAHSGDLGFTYGTYSLTIKNAGKEEGTYCTIWKKDKNHSWKFVLDTGNEGLNPQDQAADKAVKAEDDKIVKKEGKKK